MKYQPTTVKALQCLELINLLISVQFSSSAALEQSSTPLHTKD